MRCLYIGELSVCLYLAMSAVGAVDSTAIPIAFIRVARPRSSLFAATPLARLGP
jgi:hypothetical protein